jgi:Glycoside-hydrolase family GH114/Calcineurin-like phosphoesterase
MASSGRDHWRECGRIARWFTCAAVVLAACVGGGSDDDEGAIHSVARERTAAAGETDHARDSAVVVADATVIAIVGDAGELNDDTLAVARVAGAHAAEAVFTVGDNEYTTEGRSVEAYAESVGDVYGAWLDAGVFYPIPGDHDYGDGCDDENADVDLDAYLEYFELPTGPEDETYYDVRIGDVHVFALDSLVDCHRDGGAKLQRERQWLEQRATSSDAAVKIVLIHNPPYSSGTSHGSVDNLRWEYADWGVDMVVAGDDHIYERSTHDGVVYVVNGLGGVEAHELGDPIDGSDVLFADAFGALIVTSTDEGAAASFVTVDGQEIDRFEFAVDAPESPSDTSSDLLGEPANAMTPGRDTTWHWQLQGALDTSVDADLYDVDLFETSPRVIDELHADGRVVICYLSAGSYEGWRPDVDGFADADLGDTLDGFEDERWLDVRSSTVRAVYEGRLDRAVESGCDGVEPDNVDGYLNETGFDLTADDQLNFNGFIADAAHARGLLVGLKITQLWDLSGSDRRSTNDERVRV